LIYPLPLHDALPIFALATLAADERDQVAVARGTLAVGGAGGTGLALTDAVAVSISGRIAVAVSGRVAVSVSGRVTVSVSGRIARSEEHTSELQSREK